MDIARVVKKVVSTVKHESFASKPLLLVQPLHPKTLEPKGQEVLCIDLVGSAENEIVIVNKEGSSINDLLGFKKAPTDAAITGIIDTITIDGKNAFNKSL